MHTFSQYAKEFIYLHTKLTERTQNLQNAHKSLDTKMTKCTQKRQFYTNVTKWTQKRQNSHRNNKIMETETLYCPSSMKSLFNW